MTRPFNLYQLPDDLPVPSDDGACDHLPGVRLPTLPLPATDGQHVDLAAHAGRTVVYCYPRTGKPDVLPPDGWDAIPGARGCTPQSCAFRDHHQELRDLGARVFGLSTQDTAYQREAVERLHLPFPLLSDAERRFTQALRLPTFEVAGMTLLKRLTLILRDGQIEHVFYPVFPPDANAAEVVRWLGEHPPVDGADAASGLSQTMTTGLVDFYKHNLWANLQLLDACAHLTDAQLDASAPGTYGRVRDTLVHLFRAEEGYLARVTGREPESPLQRGEFPGIETLRAHACRSGEGLIAVADRVDPAQVLRGTYHDEPYELPAIVPLMQAINHATDHRSQIATMLSQLGVQPPDLSVWEYDEATRK